MELSVVDIGGGFPVSYDENVPDFEKLAEIINFECTRLFDKDVQIIAEPGRFMVANAAYLISEIIGKSTREGKIYYHINDGVYNTFSAVIFDHWSPNFEAFKEGMNEVCAVVGPTCDSFDKISLAVLLPNNLEIGDFLITKDIGAYSTVSNTTFNGFEGPSIISIN
jgi:ornithine decarboxylase